VFVLFLCTGISYLCTYDLYGPVRNVFAACRFITRASGRGLGPGNGIEPIGECHLEPKKFEISRSQMDLPASKA